MITNQNAASTANADSRTSAANAATTEVGTVEMAARVATGIKEDTAERTLETSQDRGAKAITAAGSGSQMGYGSEGSRGGYSGRENWGGRGEFGSGERGYGSQGGSGQQGSQGSQGGYGSQSSRAFQGSQGYGEASDWRGGRTGTSTYSGQGEPRIKAVRMANRAASPAKAAGPAAWAPTRPDLAESGACMAAG